MKTALDLAIKWKEKGTLDGGFVLGDRLYERYMDNEAWQAFLQEMQERYPAAYAAFASGDGNELGLKASKAPPKMACYGSSSRMLYLLAREMDGFSFERQFPTTIGVGKVNLDGYAETADARVFVEAKCHEPYDGKAVAPSVKYAPLYEYLTAADFGMRWENTPLGNGTMRTVVYAQEKRIAYFDVKQMVCHLLGIAADWLRAPNTKNIRFIYLLFNPGFLSLPQGKKSEEIQKRYRQVCDECNSIPFGTLFLNVLKYLRYSSGIGDVSLQEIEDVSKRFSFALQDQASFHPFVCKG